VYKKGLGVFVSLDKRHCHEHLSNIKETIVLSQVCIANESTRKFRLTRAHRRRIEVKSVINRGLPVERVLLGSSLALNKIAHQDMQRCWRIEIQKTASTRSRVHFHVVSLYFYHISS
jgi:hypothetical protein